jgi:hypothetical protein
MQNQMEVISAVGKYSFAFLLPFIRTARKL